MSSSPDQFDQANDPSQEDPFADEESEEQAEDEEGVEEQEDDSELAEAGESDGIDDEAQAEPKPQDEDFADKFTQLDELNECNADSVINSTKEESIQDVLSLLNNLEKKGNEGSGTVTLSEKDKAKISDMLGKFSSVTGHGCKNKYSEYTIQGTKSGFEGDAVLESKKQERIAIQTTNLFEKIKDLFKSSLGITDEKEDSTDVSGLEIF